MLAQVEGNVGEKGRGESLRDELARISSPTSSAVLIHLHSLKVPWGKREAAVTAATGRDCAYSEELSRAW